MKTAQKGSKVLVHYIGAFENGQVFDDSLTRAEPLSFKIGQGGLINGFENAVIGMEIGETREVLLPPDQAYGHKLEENYVKIKLEDLPEGLNPEIGEQLMLHPDAERQIPAQVIEKTAEYVKLDANHPMAGKNLKFTIKLIDIII